MALKNQLKKIINLLPKRVKLGLHNALAANLAVNKMPVYNMYQHIANLKNLGFNPGLVIDAGAYIGDWTRNVSIIFPTATFIMVEAQTSKQGVLQQVTRDLDKVNLEITLLGDAEKGEVEFFEMETGSSIYEENTHYERKKVRLKMQTLDTVAEKYKIPESCFIKLDVQGAELDILKGAARLLAHTDFILLEVSVLNYNEKAPQLAEVIAFLKGIGYVLFDICDERRKENEVLFQVDLIFVKESSNIRKSLDFKKVN